MDIFRRNPSLILGRGLAARTQAELSEAITQAFSVAISFAEPENWISGLEICNFPISKI